MALPAELPVFNEVETYSYLQHRFEHWLEHQFGFNHHQAFVLETSREEAIEL